MEVSLKNRELSVAQTNFDGVHNASQLTPAVELAIHFASNLITVTIATNINSHKYDMNFAGYQVTRS